MRLSSGELVFVHPVSALGTPVYGRPGVYRNDGQLLGWTYTAVDSRNNQSSGWVYPTEDMAKEEMRKYKIRLRQLIARRKRLK